MKSLHKPICIIGGFLSLYLLGYVIYYYTNLGVNPTTPLGRAIGSFFAPCLKTQDAWREHQEKKMEMMQFIGKWEGFEGTMSIEKGGRFTIQAGNQTIRGDGEFREIDGILHFVAETKCRLEKDKELDLPLKLSIEDPYDPGMVEYHDEICRIQMHVFQADNPDAFQLAASLSIFDLKNEAPYYYSEQMSELP